MPKFKTGDRVVATRAEHEDNKGKTGVVVGYTHKGWTGVPIVEMDDGSEVYLNEYKLDLLPLETTHTLESLTKELQDAIDKGWVTSPYWQRGFILTAMEANND